LVNDIVSSEASAAQPSGGQSLMEELRGSCPGENMRAGVSNLPSSFIEDRSFRECAKSYASDSPLSVELTSVYTLNSAEINLVNPMEINAENLLKL